MSKFFYNSRVNPKQDRLTFGYQNRGTPPLGSKSAPLSLSVGSESRKAEIEAILAEHSLFATLELNSDREENIVELETLLNKPTTVELEQTPNRNDLCSCGSGKKYKKCCG